MIANRLQKYLEISNLNASQLANTLSVTKNAVYNIIKGRAKPSGPVLQLLKIKHNINPDWLLTGEGEMFLTSPQGGYTPPPDPTAQLKGKDKESARDYIEYLGDKPKLKQYKENEQEFEAWLSQRQKELTPLPQINIKEIEEQAKFPTGRMAEVNLMYGRVAAGNPSEIFEIEEPKKTYQIDKLLLGTNDTKDIFALEIKGDSMIGAGIFEKDIVIFKPVFSHTEIKNKTIVLASIDNELTIKRMITDTQPNTLKAENPKYPPIELNTDQHIIVAKFLLLISDRR